MDTTEKLGVTVTNPAQEIRIEGRSFAEVIAHQALHVETLRKAVAVLVQQNPHAENEQLAEVQVALMAMANTMGVMLFEHVRWAMEQGLHLELPKADAARH